MTVNHNKIVFDLKNSLSELQVLERHLEDFGNSASLSEKTMFELNLALEELVVNIISYGYADQEEHRITVAIALEDGVLTIRMEDDGIPFNPIERAESNVAGPLEERRIGGYGIRFVRRLMNEMVYERRGNRNVLTIKKRLHAC